MSETRHLRPDGFRERGGEVTRIEAFVDAAFAFALTMLVISVGAIPDDMPKLILAIKGTPAFAASFIQIAAFWYAHMTWSRRYGLDDSASVVLSLVLVFLVMIFIYPLKIVFATFFGWISGGWLPYNFTFGSVADLRMMFVIYGVVFGTLSLVIVLLYRHALRQADDLGLSLRERERTVVQITRSALSAGMAVVSIAVAYALPEHGPGWMMGSPGMVYALLGFSGLIGERAGRRARTRMQAENIA